MKISRLTAILLIFVLLFSLISCKENDPHDNHDNHGNQDTSDNQQGDVEQSGGEGFVTFYYSVNSEKYHLADCYHVYAIEEKFLKTSNDAAALAADGYAPCRDCIAVRDDASEDEDNNRVSKENATYVIGTSGNRLHELDCHNVKKIHEENIRYTDLSIEELMELDEYVPCRDCLPDEADDYYERHPEKDPNNK